MAFPKSHKRAQSLLTGVASAALAFGLAAPAQAQTYTLEPTFGVVELDQNFGDSATTIQAGGDIDASGYIPECSGFIADAPDLVLEYSGTMALEITATSDADTTMLLEMPDGMLLCNDDFDGLNPGIVTASGESGRFAIWIGTFEPIENNTYPDATVRFAEVMPVDPEPVAVPTDVTGFNTDMAPTFGDIAVTAGFGTQVFDLQAGGSVDAFAINDSCAGYIAEAPDYTVQVSGDIGPALHMDVASGDDTTLVVVDPQGQVFCNDDAVDLNPGLSLQSPAAGNYAVWVGTFNPTGDVFPEATLTVSTDGSANPTPSSPSAFDISGTPTFGRVSLNGADLATGHSLTLQAGGAVDAFSVNNACAGFVAETPDYVVDYGGGRVPMQVAVASDVDTTLVVVTPDGRTLCNDDDIDLNPGLTIDNPVAGAYAVFVGTYLPIENDFYPDATISFTSGSRSANPGQIPERARLAPTFGSTSLSPGFGSHQVEIQAGGNLQGADLGPTCNGFVAEAPDYVVNYSGSEALRITATSDNDTTMTVIAPDGQVLCNDDFSGLNPGLVGPEGVAGDYAIWIGTFDPIENDVYPPASILVAEVSANKQHPAGAITSTSLTAGFTPDPFTTTLAAGGLVDASTVDPACYGSIASQPDFTLDYTSGDWPLRIYVDSDADTTLLVRTPSGDVLCNDDFDGLNPSVALSDPRSGTYEVYVGTYDVAGGNPNATLAITELLDQKVLPEGAQTQTTIFQGTARQDFELLAGGSFEAFSTFGASCNGYVASEPDFTTIVQDGGVDVEFTVRSAEDTTLAVRTPSGQYVCDDDSAGDFNPLVTVEGAQIGTYEVWLGTFSAVGNAPATLSVRDMNADSGTAPNVPGGGKK